MRKTCSECIFHTCRSECGEIEKPCSGWCERRRQHKKCDITICKLFEQDEFFTTALDTI